MFPRTFSLLDNVRLHNGREIRGRGINLAGEIIGVDVLDEVWTGSIQIAIAEICRGFKDLILPKCGQLRVSENL